MFRGDSANLIPFYNTIKFIFAPSEETPASMQLKLVIELSDEAGIIITFGIILIRIFCINRVNLREFTQI